MITVEEQRTMQAIQQLNRKIPEVTLRDLFAMSTIPTLLKDFPHDDESIKAMTRKSYKLADAMLEARKQ